MYLVINKCGTAVKVSNFSGHYLRNRSTLDIGVLGYIGIVQHKEHSPEVCPFLLGHSVYHKTVHRKLKIILFIKCNKQHRLSSSSYDASTSHHRKILSVFL